MYNRKLVFTAACLGILMFGIILTTLGAILPFIIEKFGIDKASAGSLMLLMSFGILTGSLIFGPIVDRYGYKRLLIICATIIFICLEAIAFAPNFSLLRLAIFIVGLAGGVINGGTNALVADISEEGKSAELSILGIFFGIGAIGVPLSMGALLKYLSYDHIMAGVGLVVIIPLFFFILLRFPSSKQAQGFPIKEGLSLLKEIPLLLFGMILFFESGMEITVGSWSALFVKEELSITTNRAVLFLSFYWLGIVLARLVLGYILKKISPVIVQFTSVGVALFGALLMLFSNNLYLSIAGLFLLGCGFAAGFPVMLGYVGNLYPKLSGTAFSIAFAMALTGGMILPYLTGITGQSLGLRTSFIIIPISLCCLAILFGIVIRKIQKS
ncbi:MFS transporter [candidate division KSB1 bacterium]|nr:MAG: MFS transporter [candidate division KSB1 bacterium]